MFFVPKVLNSKTQFSFTEDASGRTKESKNRDCVERVCHNLETTQRIPAFDNSKMQTVQPQ